MNIDKRNFDGHLDVIIETINQCAYVAIDTEFTALDTNVENRVTSFDDSEQLYQTQKSKLKDVSICQIGFSIYNDEKSSNEYTVQSYSFYVCPESFMSYEPNVIFQMSSVEFLKDYNFDFQRWLSHGIPCMNGECEAKVRKDFRKLVSSYNSQRLSREVESQLSLLKDWERSESGDVIPLINLKKKTDVLYFMVAVYKRHPNLIPHLSENGEVYVACSEVPNRNEVCLENIMETLDQFLKYQCGFVRLTNALKKAQKPIVVHNGFTDLLLFYQQFVGCLPNTFYEFQQNVHEMFPFIFDTKEIAFRICRKFYNIEELKFLKSTELRNVTVGLEAFKLDTITKMPSIKHHFRTANYNDSKYHFHESGFDAFCTGRVLLQLAHINATLDAHMKDEGERQLCAYEHLNTLNVWRNRLPVQRAGIAYVVFGDESPLPKEDYWMVLQSKSAFSTLAMSDAVKLIEPICRVDMKQIDNTRIILSVNRQVIKRMLLDAFKQQDKYQLVKYSRIHHAPRFRSALWSCFAASAGLGTLFGWRLFKKS